MATPVTCRLLGHRWSFEARGREVRWSCRRCDAAGGEHAYDSHADARRMAAALERGAPGPPRGLLAAMGGMVARRERSDRDEERA